MMPQHPNASPAEARQQTKRSPRGILDRFASLQSRLAAALGVSSKKRKKYNLDEVFARLEKLDLVCREEYSHLVKIRREKRVEINQPLVLISQIQRSGGTLMSQLFDAHPQCHAHPYELFIGYPKKMIWPVLDLQAGPREWFKTLFEKPVLRSFYEGYTKYGKGIEEDLEIFPFIFLPSLQKAIFEDCISARTIASQRDIFDCYMTSYFNAWLDNQNLYGKDKRIITAFVPRMGMDEANLERFFGTYPDGKLLCIIRDPKSWWVSARKHKPEVYGDLETAVGLWRESTQAILSARIRYGNRVLPLRFEELVTTTEATMRRVASFVGIDFHPSLLTPTFNGLPIKADSSYKVPGYGVIKDPVERHRHLLSTAECERITALTGDLYTEAEKIMDACRV
ncbi:MAG: sulfotransferase [Gemmatales bacterium]|nr:sulfotransferase [Gemmatales bacterium]MDW8385622.1 sulfotransferase [Gemmatales bacterium]